MPKDGGVWQDMMLRPLFRVAESFKWSATVSKRGTILPSASGSFFFRISIMLRKASHSAMSCAPFSGVSKRICFSAEATSAVMPQISNFFLPFLRNFPAVPPNVQRSPATGNGERTGSRKNSGKNFSGSTIGTIFATMPLRSAIGVGSMVAMIFQGVILL